MSVFELFRFDSITLYKQNVGQFDDKETLINLSFSLIVLRHFGLELPLLYFQILNHCSRYFRKFMTNYFYLLTQIIKKKKKTSIKVKTSPIYTHLRIFVNFVNSPFYNDKYIETSNELYVISQTD